MPRSFSLWFFAVCMSGWVGVCAVALHVQDPAARSSPAITWVDDLDTAYAQAIGHRQPLILYFHMHGSPWCDKLEQEVFSSEEFGAFARRGVFARINIEQENMDAETKELMATLEVDEVPTVWTFCMATGEAGAVSQSEGYFPVDEFMPFFVHHFEACEATGRTAPQPPPVRKPYEIGNIEIGAEPPATMQGVCTVADMAVARALAEMGYAVETFKQTGGTGCTFKMNVEHNGVRLPLWITHVYGGTIALDVPLITLDNEAVSAAALLKLLEANYTIFPAQFSYDAALKQLKLSQPIDQGELLTAKGFRDALAKLLHTMDTHELLWSGLPSRD